MRISALIAVIVGLVLATASVVTASRFLRSETEIVRLPAAQPAVEIINLRSVVIAARDLAHGSRLDQASLEIVEWPAKSAPEAGFSRLEEIFADQPRPHRLMRRVRAGEPIVRPALSGFNKRETISAQLAEGMRAVSIRVNDISGVAGFLLPGDHVDVLLTRRDRDQSLVTAIILQNIRVIGVDQTADLETDTPRLARAVTVEAGPEQAQILALAMQAGALSLALRQTGANETVASTNVNVNDLGGGRVTMSEPEPIVIIEEKVVVKEAPRRELPTLRIRRGSEVSVVTVHELGGEGAAPVNPVNDEYVLGGHNAN